MAKLQDYSARTKETEYALDTREPENYGLRVNKTLQSLQNQVKQNEAALEKVRRHFRWIGPTSPNSRPAAGKSPSRSD